MKRIEPLYYDFINNCNDPWMVDSLNKVFKIVTFIDPGKTFPVKSVKLADGSDFNLAKACKGKTTCLVFWKWGSDRDSSFRKEIAKFRSDEVEFFVFFVAPYSRIVPSSLQKPNVHFFLVDEKSISGFLLFTGGIRIILLNKWYRVFDDKVTDPVFTKGSDEFEQAIRKAIQAKRYSKEEKAVIYKTIGWSLGSILVTVIIGLLLYRTRIRRIRQQEAVQRQIRELEIKAIRSQMNPHFIFNALNSIQSLVNGNLVKDANIYLAKFAVLLRRILHNSDKAFVTLSDELEALELYCQLEQLRFEFKLDISIGEGIDCNLVEIPGMLLQPLAENAIIHGLSPKGEQGVLSISIGLQNGNLHIRVSDNGVGLPPQTSKLLRQNGFGLKLVEERLHILGQGSKQATLEILNKGIAGGTGTTVELTIPID